MRASMLTAILVFWGNSYLFGQESNYPQPQSVEAENNKPDKIFWATSAALISFSVFDLETTHSCIRRGLCVEKNPLARPFISAGRPASYGFNIGLDAGVIYLAYRLRTHSNQKLCRLWWIVPAIFIMSHGAAAAANLRFAFK